MSTNAPTNIISLYYKIFWILMALLVLTVGVAYADLGKIGLFVALTIAIVKAALVILFFMHAKYSSKAIWVYASAGFLWLIIGLVLSLSDYMTRI